MPLLEDVLASSANEDSAPAPKNKTMLLEDAISLPRVREEEFSFKDGVLEISDEQRSEWDQLGKIGPMEQLRRQDKTEMIPFNPEALGKSLDLLRATKRLRDPNITDSQKEKDSALVSNYLFRLEEERHRGFTIGGRVVQGVAQLPAFMIEFAATGGVAALGRGLVKKGISRSMRKIVQSRAAKAGARVAGGAAGAAARTAALPKQVAESFANRQLAAGLEFTGKGIKIADEVTEKPQISALKAFGDVFIESFSEVTGPALRSGASSVAPQAVKDGLEKLFKRMRPNETVSKLWTKAGYNGFLEEMGEERVGAFLRALTGVEDFGADNPDSAWDRIVASIPNGEELLVEAGVLSVPGALRMGTSQVVDLVRSRKAEDSAAEPELESLSDAEADAIAQGPVEEAAESPAATEPGRAPGRVVPFEAIPSESLGEPIFSASPEEKAVFTERALGIVRDAETGRDTLGEDLGIDGVEIVQSSGGFQGQISPNAIAIISRETSVEKVREYARAVQYIYKQDAVPFLRLQPVEQEGEANTFRITFSEDISPEREAEFFDAIRGALTDQAGYTKLKDNQIIVSNFGDFDPKVFVEALDRFGAEYAQRLGIASVTRENSEGENLEHDWKSDPEGSILRSQANPEGRSDVQSRLDRRRQSFETLLSESRETLARGRGRRADRPRARPETATSLGLLPGTTASSPGPDQRILEAARRYAESAGIPYRRQAEYVSVDTELAGRLADAFGAMEHNPADPQVRAAYEALIVETLAQYQVLKELGIVAERIPEGSDNPYKNSKEMIADVRDNNHIWFFPTTSGFGSDAAFNDHPLMAETNEEIGGVKLRANDVFRIVHDIFGHVKEGNSFGPRGEENAWQAHVRMFSPLAARAMTSETRGQNSFVNYGPNGEHNRRNPAQTIYADQKAGLMPAFAMTEGLAPDVIVTSKEIVSEKVGRGRALTEEERAEFPDLAGIETELRSINEQIPQALTEQASQSLRARRGVLLQSLGFSPTEALTLTSPVSRQIRRATGQIKPKEKPTVGAFAAFKAVLRAQEQAARTAERFTKKQIKKAQADLIKALEETKIAPEDRAKFIRTIKNIQTQEQLFEALPGIAERVQSLAEASSRRKALSEIKKELKDIKPKKKGRAKFTPTTQDALLAMRSALRMSPENAAAALAKKLQPDASGAIPTPTGIDALENMALNAAAHKEDLTSIELNQILDTIKALKLSGKGAAKVKQLREQMELEDERDAVNSIVESRPEGHIPVSNEEQNFSSVYAWWTRATNWLVGWDNIMNRISWNDKSTKTNASLINIIASVHDQKVAEKKANRRAIQFLHRAYQDAFGKMTAFEMESAFIEDSVEKNIGTFTNAVGKKQTLIMSKDQARTLWMQFRDPTLFETFFGAQEKGMHYTQEMRRAVEKQLNSKDLQFVRTVFENYQKTYVGFNDVFSDMNGYNLKQNPFYSPIQRKFDSQMADEAEANQLLGEVAHRQSLVPGAAIARVKNLRSIKQVGLIENYIRHTTQVNHYIAWAKKIRQLRAIFGNEAIRDAIKVNFGKDLMSKIDGFIDDFTRGGIDRSHEMANLNAIKNNIVISTLALKPALSAKQVVSFAAFWDTMPAKHFVRGMTDLLTDTKRKLKILNSSELMRARGIALTPELGEAINSKEYLVFQLRPTVKNWLLFNVKFGDRAAILLGGWSVYRYNREVLGKSKRESLKAFEIAFDSSQQSSDLDQQSWLQRGNSFQRLTGVFMSSQNQYLRKEIAATDDLFAGRITKEEWAKTMFIYHILLPTMFQFVASGFKFEWKEMTRAALVGSLNGWFILHDLLMGIASTILGLKTFPSGGVIDSGFRQMRRAMREIKEADVDMESFLEALEQTSKAVGLATGLPAPAAIGIIEGTAMMMDAQDGAEWRKGFKRAAGWSKFVLDQGEEPTAF